MFSTISHLTLSHLTQFHLYLSISTNISFQLTNLVCAIIQYYFYNLILEYIYATFTVLVKYFKSGKQDFKVYGLEGNVSSQGWNKVETYHICQFLKNGSLSWTRTRLTDAHNQWISIITKPQVYKKSQEQCMSCPSISFLSRIMTITDGERTFLSFIEEEMSLALKDSGMLVKLKELTFHLLMFHDTP